MSSSIVRKGLELCNDDLIDYPKDGKKKKKQLENTSKKKHKRTPSMKQKEKLGMKNRKMKSAIDQYKKETDHDHTKDNIRYMKLLMNVGKPSSDVTEKIVRHGVKQKTKDMTKEKKSEETVFTEEDFAKFEKEYAG